MFNDRGLPVVGKICSVYEWTSLVFEWLDFQKSKCGQI